MLGGGHGSCQPPLGSATVVRVLVFSYENKDIFYVNKSSTKIMKIYSNVHKMRDYFDKNESKHSKWFIESQ